LKDNYDQYYATFLFGQNQQPLDLNLDTGSSLTWVPSQLCDRKQCLGERFDHDNSISFKNYQVPQEARYKYGSISGVLVNDYISVQQTIPSRPRAKVNFVSVNQAKNLPPMFADG